MSNDGLALWVKMGKAKKDWTDKAMRWIVGLSVPLLFAMIAGGIYEENKAVESIIGPQASSCAVAFNAAGNQGPTTTVEALGYKACKDMIEEIRKVLIAARAGKDDKSLPQYVPVQVKLPDGSIRTLYVIGHDGPLSKRLFPDDPPNEKLLHNIYNPPNRSPALTGHGR